MKRKRLRKQLEEEVVEGDVEEGDGEEVVGIARRKQQLIKVQKLVSLKIKLLTIRLSL